MSQTQDLTDGAAAVIARIFAVADGAEAERLYDAIEADAGRRLERRRRKYGYKRPHTTAEVLTAWLAATDHALAGKEPQ